MSRPPRIAWSWQSALLGAAYAIPAAVIAVGDPTRGVAFGGRGPAGGDHRASGATARTPCHPGAGDDDRRADTGKAAGISGLMVVGPLFACAVSMLWPERDPPAPATSGAPPTYAYGLRLGAAGGSAAALAYLFGLLLPRVLGRRSPG